MSRTVQPTLGPMELQKVESALSTPLKSIEAWRALITRSFGRAGLSQKRAAAEMGVPEPQLSRQLNGAEHLSFWRMFRLPREFWAELLPLIADYHGLTLNGSPQERVDAEIGRLVREAVTRAVVSR